MPRQIRGGGRAIVSSLAALFLASPLFAQSVSYDRYAPLWREGPLVKKPSSAGEILSRWGTHFLVYPFEFVRWPMDQGLVLIDKYRVYDKADWIYEQLKNHGFTPKVRSLLGGDGLGGGFKVEFVQLAALKDRAPDSNVEGSTLWTLDKITEYRAKIMQDRIAETGVRAGGFFEYTNRGEEHFYGIGPNTSLGDGTSYRMERTTLETILGWNFLNTWDLEGTFDFQNVNITNGEDGGRGKIDEIFVQNRNQQIPGLAGDEILTWALGLKHDNRDDQDVPTEGGYEKLHVSYHKGMDSSAGFLRYRGEIIHFFKLFSDRRILGLRGVAEHNDEISEERDIPFFSLARLGGYGTHPRIGDAHRGYKRDRFYDESLLLFNVEYRWTAWEYREWRMDPVLFCDVGQVFGEWSHLQMEDFSLSYGFGFRFSYEKENLLSLEMARSSDGTEFYVKTRAPF